MLQVNRLSCERGARVLFTDITFSVVAGEVFQIVGGNGAGKTTLLKILMGIYSTFEGEVNWGLESPPVYLSHKAGIKGVLTVAENLRWLCRLHHRQVTGRALAGVLEELSLAGCADRLCSTLSEGQRKRVSLARFFLLQDNPCWVLDEPFSAVDAAGIALFEARLLSHVNQGGLVILASHQPLFTTAASVEAVTADPATATAPSRQVSVRQLAL